MLTDKNPITGKYILRGWLRAVTPIHMGSGRAENSEMDIIRDSDGRPCIPASAFLGVLRHAIPAAVDRESEGFQSFWGYSRDEEGRQSGISCRDLLLDESKGPPAVVVLRDGVEIDNTTGLAKKTGKFDFELLERGAVFRLEIEVTRRERDPDTGKFLRTIIELLNQGRIRVGARTNNGLGQLRPKGNLDLFIYDFALKKDVLAWLKGPGNNHAPADPKELGEPWDISRSKCFLTARLQLKGSLVVRSYGNEPEQPDAVQLRSGPQWVLPGSSIKGALRARAERIVNTLGLANGRELLRDLFGYVDQPEEGLEGAQKKGRLRVKDVYLDEQGFSLELQSRIRVNRFTGGVQKGALFDTMPVFAKKESPPLEFTFEIDKPCPAEIGLLLLLLKDLWTGDLAVGGEKNIGRGVFQGKGARITANGLDITLNEDISELPEENRKRLQEFVTALSEGE